MHLSVRRCFALYGLICLALLGSGLLLGELKRLQPCHLCNLQRLYYMVLAVVAGCGVFWPGWRKLWAGLAVLASLGGVFAAGQQSWMQFAPQLATECGFGEPSLAEQLINWFGTLWPSMFMVTGFCTQQEWIFLGLSLANWSGVCFLLLFLCATWIFLRRRF